MIKAVLNCREARNEECIGLNDQMKNIGLLTMRMVVEQCYDVVGVAVDGLEPIARQNKAERNGMDAAECASGGLREEGCAGVCSLLLHFLSSFDLPCRGIAQFPLFLAQSINLSVSLGTH